MIPFRRCSYLDSQGLQCEKWFPAEGSDKLCDLHSGVIRPNGTDVNKVKYIDLVNVTRAACHLMTIDTLDEHIAGLEKELEDLKTKLYASTASRREKLDALTEEERKELRKIKIERAVTQPTSKQPTIKSNPIAYAMKKFNLSEEKAKELLGL